MDRKSAQQQQAADSKYCGTKMEEADLHRLKRLYTANKRVSGFDLEIGWLAVMECKRICTSFRCH